MWWSGLENPPPTPGNVPRGVTESGFPSNSRLHQKTKDIKDEGMRSRAEGDGGP